MAEAAALIRQGGVVGFPTETVYGLGADATDPAAVARIFAAKERPRFNPLIAHLPDRMAAEAQGVFDDAARTLAQAFWPGPLTLVVPAAIDCTVSALARAGLPSVALRVPDNDLARSLLAGVGRPVAAPSANRSGRVSPTAAAHVLADLDGRIAAVLDGGETPVGVESTVVACLGGPPRLLRPGASPARPGGLSRCGASGAGTRRAAHRAGPAGLALRTEGARTPRRDGRTAGGSGSAVRSRSTRRIGARTRAVQSQSDGDLAEAATRLFSALRYLDAQGVKMIAVAPVPMDGLGEAINDRLRRAAAPR